MLFTHNMKLADMVTANHSLVLILQRFNIQLGFGEKSIKEVCRQYSIPDNFFLLICNVYTHPEYLPTQEEIAGTDMSPLIPYLVASHNYYLQERIPHIENHLRKIAAACQPVHGDTLQKFFTEYKGHYLAVEPKIGHEHSKKKINYSHSFVAGFLFGIGR